MISLPPSCFLPPVCTEYPERHAPGVKAVMYDSVPYQGKKTQVFAWIGLPENASEEHPVPGMVLVHGGLGTAFPRWVQYWNSKGYAAIAMDTCGAVPPQENLNQSCAGGTIFPRHAAGGPANVNPFCDILHEAEEDTWEYHALAAVISAHSLLRSLPEVDETKTGITGVSWGGYLTCLAAGTDERFRLAMPVYGCGCFTRESGLCPPSQVPETAFEKWKTLRDPEHFLCHAKQPFLWLTGTNDFAFSLAMLADSMKVHAGEDYPAVKVNMPHTHGPVSEEAPELPDFCDRVFRGKNMPVRFRHGSTGHAVLEGTEEIQEANFHYTRSSGFRSDRVWNTMPAKFDPVTKQLSAVLPDFTTACFFSVKTADGLHRSSGIREL